MKFTDWQLSAMRTALHLYRIHYAVNGIPVPWKTMLDKIERVGSEASTGRAGTTVPQFKEEALRRFAAGPSTLQPDRLMAVKGFLLESGFMTAIQFTDGPDGLHRLHVACASMAGKTSFGSFFQPGSPRSFVAMRPARPFGETVFLEIGDEEETGVFRVMEEVHATTGESQEEAVYRRDYPNRKREFRRGYGCFLTRLGLLHIFLEGIAGYPDEVVTYVQAAPLGPDSRSFYLMRASADVPALIHPVEALGDPRFAALANVYLFNSI